MPTLVSLYEQGNFQKVIHNSRTLLGEFTHAVSLWTLIGASFEAQGKFYEVLESLKKVVQFQSALALQCFTNEYIYDQTEAENNAIEIFNQSVESIISNGVQPSAKLILCSASYKAIDVLQNTY